MKFKTGQHEYNLFFYSSPSFSQVNLKTGTKRAVKRRPLEFVSLENIEDLKWLVFNIIFIAIPLS